MRTRILQFVPPAAVAVVICMAAGGWFASKKTPALIQPIAAAEPSYRDELDQLLKKRYETARKLLELEEARLREGITTLGRVCDAARWVRDSAIELPAQADERLTALNNYVALARRLEESVDKAAQRGMSPPSDREFARYLRLDAEIGLLRARQAPGSKTGSGR